MIRNLKGRALSRLYEHGERGGIRPDLVDSVIRILTLLDIASSPEDLQLPGLRLHPLKGDRRGFWSVTVRANWRVIFRFDEGDAVDVELIDYH